MSYAKPINVSDAQTTDVIAVTLCAAIEVYEEDQAATSDYYVTGSDPNSQTTLRPAGKPYIFIAPTHNLFQPLQKVGKLQLFAGGGSVTFNQVETP